MTFTDKKPTVPGVYWWQPLPEIEPQLSDVCDEGGKLFSWILGNRNEVESLSGLWSSRLVPSDESEAYQEGYQHAFDEIVHSRARRVVEGNESP